MGAGRRDCRSRCEGAPELRERTCRECGALFVICRSCDRGHAYCSGPCWFAARRRSLRAARRRHRMDESGRADHRDRERARRLRHRADEGGDHPNAGDRERPRRHRVVDQGRKKLTSATSHSCAATAASTRNGRTRPRSPAPTPLVDGWSLSKPPMAIRDRRCIVCGFRGTVVHALE